MTTYTRKYPRGSKVKKSMKLLNTKKGGSKQDSHLTKLNNQINLLKATAERLGVLAEDYQIDPIDEKKYGHYNPIELSNVNKNPKTAIKAASNQVKEFCDRLSHQSDTFKEDVPVEYIARYNGVLSAMRINTDPEEILRIWRHYLFVKSTSLNKDRASDVVHRMDYAHRLGYKGKSFSPFQGKYSTSIDIESIREELKRRRKNRKSLPGIEKPSAVKSLQIKPKTPNPEP